MGRRSFKSYKYTNKFAIIRRAGCKTCGLFSFYIVHLGCINYFISKGYIPIIDLSSFPNVFNRYKPSLSQNPWELYFNQPFKHSLREVKQKANTIKYFKCVSTLPRPNDGSFLLNKVLINYWHNIANIYMPIKEEIIIESNNIMSVLFKDEKNILGVLIRGTDYVVRKPKHHPIPPGPETLIKDIKKIDSYNNYNYIYLATEDDIIREKIIKEFYSKIKFYKYKKSINYNYKSKKLLGKNSIIQGNLEYTKIYLINIIILSKCIDIISCRTSGTAGVFVITKGFRNIKIYFLGNYK